MIYAYFPFNYLYSFPFAQFPYELPYFHPFLVVKYFPSVRWCKYYMVLKKARGTQLPRQKAAHKVAAFII